MKRIIVLCILFLIFFVFTLSGQSKIDSLIMDTVKIGSKNVLIEIPYISYKQRKIDSYAEGTFVYYPFIDTSLLFIHGGALVNIPFFTGFQFYELKEKTERDSIISYKGLCKNKYFREDYYTQYRINIIYKDIPNDYIFLFDFIMDNVRIYR
jgi:hypothetical protein